MLTLENDTARVWADGFGVWRVSIVKNMRQFNPLEQARYTAREVILREIVLREQKTWATWEDAYERVGDCTVVDLVADHGDRWEFVERPFPNFPMPDALYY